jgi:hypothetical protein
MKTRLCYNSDNINGALDVSYLGLVTCATAVTTLCKLKKSCFIGVFISIREIFRFYSSVDERPYVVQLPILNSLSHV